MLSLTDSEKNFFANFWYETLDLQFGQALRWLRENGIEEREVWPFTTLFQKGFGLYPPKPETCDMPWSSADEFRARAEELSPLMNERLRKGLTAP